MTEKQISFSGLNLTPYSDISPDGQLSASVGLEIHDGSIRPSVLAGEKYILPQSHNSIHGFGVPVATGYSCRHSGTSAASWAVYAAVSTLLPARSAPPACG